MKRFAWAIALTCAATAPAAAQVVYSNDFSANNNGFGANTATWQTPTNCISSNYCGSYLGASGSPIGYFGGGSGRSLGNDVATLSLSSLASHTGGTLAFTLLVLDSWDGNATSFGPDLFDVRVNGTNLLHTTFSIFGPNQAYPGTYPAGDFPARTGAAEDGTMGTWFWTSAPGSNSVYNIMLSFVDASSNLTIDFEGSGLQGISDESWGLKQVDVALTGGGVTSAPEPASLALMATGLVGVGAAVRRRRRNRLA